MNINLHIEECLLLYTIVLLAFVAASYILFRLRRKADNWEPSRARLMSCRKCEKVFLMKRQQIDRRCPACGEISHEFRPPHSVLFTKLR
ncbi:MAG: hypothetical protein GX946_00440 [Oligosphaeraceae bacterium]|nr:hypothetical protein [Oligosphaeraceae bacterium]